MPSKWAERKLGDVLTLQRGFDLPESQRIPGPYPVIASTGQVGTHSAAIVRGPGVVIGRSGSLGGGQFIRSDFWPLNTTLWIKEFKGNNRRFCYYLLKSLNLSNFNAGSGVPTLNRNHIHPLLVCVPEDIDEQRAIADILGTLDDKIERNRRMNETLEEIARAIFTSWFVDFDPVIDNTLASGNPIPHVLAEKAARRQQALARAKADGRNPKLPKYGPDLFPERFIDSVLGPIPEGWKVGQLRESLYELVSGSRPRGGAVSEGVPSIGAENVLGLGLYDFSKEKYVPQDLYEKLSMKGAVIRPGDILLYKDGAQIGRKTYFDCDFPHAKSAINEHVFILRANDALFQRFLFFWLDQMWMTQQIISLNSNSAQPGINQRGVRSLPILLPGTKAVREFDGLISPFVQRLFQNCLESRTLARLRDALLPKLISGELRLIVARRLLEDA